MRIKKKLDQSYQFLLTKVINNKIMYENIKKARRDPILKNIKNLQEALFKVETKNSAKYNQIIKLNPNFQCKLHKVVIPSYQTRQQLSLAENILMTQIDKCMEEQERLNMELDKLQIKVKEQEIKIEKQLQLNMDHYTFLRKIWKKDQQDSSSDNKVDKLIHNVGSIKGHIINLIKKQTHIYQSAPQIHELVISSPEYCQLLKKYEELKSDVEKLSQQKHQITNYSSDSSIQNQDYKRQNQLLQAQVAKLKLQIENKNIQIQKLKSKQKINEQTNFVAKSLQSIDSEFDSNKSVLCSFISMDGTFKINIREVNKSQSFQQLADKQIFDQIDQSTPRTKQTLQMIIKFLEGNDSRRVGRTNVDLEGKRESIAKKYTVQQIARPKFISNKQIIPAKNSQATTL